MNYKRIKITTENKIQNPDIFCEEISNLLLIAGIDTFTIEDYHDLEENLSKGGIFYDYIDDELLESENKPVVIYAYTNDDEEGNAVFADLKERFARFESENDYGKILISSDTVKDEDWENNWKQYYKPFTVGKSLAIKPSWETLPDGMADGRKVIEIDPSSSFGTGSHATTKLCMEFLEEVIKDGDKSLDMGCGSGILSIASLLLGGSYANAVDIDEVASRIAKENLENNISDIKKFSVYAGDVLSDTSLSDKLGCDYDIILANIVAGVIIMMKNLFYNKLKSGAYLISSGILNEREEEVINALTSTGFEKISCKRCDGWSAILFYKP